MIPASIALRNLFRNRRRSILSLVIVSVGTAGLLLTVGFVRYSFEGLREAIIRGGLGHLEVAPADALEAGGAGADRPGLPPSFRDWNQVRDVIESRPNVLGAGATIQFAGVATTGDSSASFFGVAVEPDRERRIGIDLRLRGGSNLGETPPSEGEETVLLGIGLARALDAGPGDTVTLVAPTPDASLNALDLSVAGVFTTGFQDLDSRILKTHLITAQRLLGTDYVTSLVVGLTDAETADRTVADLRAELAGHSPPLSVLDWETRAPFYGQVRSLYRSIFVFLGIIVALLVALSTSNTIMMSVLERIREFGTLLAIGTSRTQLAGMVILEALWLAILGGLGGSGLGIALAALINVLEIEMPPPPAAVDPMILALAVVPADLLFAVAFMAAILTVAAIPPILRLFRLQIVEALGHV
ncbi:MAG TPA: FtsX-like permease family protein [Thermoanaerobaculia bacterium]|nr:FtsX-like permease family protein [Thermoanaerobaculia bacterium]